jgi:hypothetical protein
MMRENLSLTTLLVFFCVIAIILLLISGCADPYQDCIDQQKQEYRDRNPQASYGQVQSRQKDFELMCAKFKK